MTTHLGSRSRKASNFATQAPRKVDHGRSGGILHTISEDVKGDLSLARNIRIHESHTLNFRLEAFNSTNHPNWNVPASVDVRTATFGVIWWWGNERGAW